MRLAITGLIGFGLFATYYIGALSAEAPPAADVLVAAPRAQVFAQLDPLFAAIHTRAAETATVTGTPPIKVAYTFERVPGAALGLTARAGFRTVTLRVRLSDGPRPGTTAIAVVAEPESLIATTGKPDPLSAVSDVLARAEPQFGDGERVRALFDSGLYDPARPDRPYR